MKKNLSRDQKVLLLKMKLNMETSEASASSADMAHTTQKVNVSTNLHPQPSKSQTHHGEQPSHRVKLSSAADEAVDSNAVLDNFKNTF